MRVNVACQLKAKYDKSKHREREKEDRVEVA